MWGDTGGINVKGASNEALWYVYSVFLENCLQYKSIGRAGEAA